MRTASDLALINTRNPASYRAELALLGVGTYCTRYFDISLVPRAAGEQPDKLDRVGLELEVVEGDESDKVMEVDDKLQDVILESELTAEVETGLAGVERGCIGR